MPKLAAIIADVTEEAPARSANSTLGEAAEPEKISLTSRELEVLRCVVQGLANKEIAVRLEISESAVKNTLQQLFTKVGVRSRSQLVRVAMEHYRNRL